MTHTSLPSWHSLATLPWRWQSEIATSLLTFIWNVEREADETLNKQETQIEVFATNRRLNKRKRTPRVTRVHAVIKWSSEHARRRCWRENSLGASEDRKREVPSGESFSLRGCCKLSASLGCSSLQRSVPHLHLT